MKVNKYSYKLKTFSKVILSPRENNAFYSAAGDFKEEEIRLEKINIIYPFYQYGSYEKYNTNADYYIPGSSIKGSILSNLNSKDPVKMIVDDVQIKSEDIDIYNLHKFQYISEDTTENPKIEKFFPNIAVEMLKSGIEVNGEIFTKTEIKNYLSLANKRTINILSQFKNRIDKITFTDESKDSFLTLNQIKENVSGLLKKVEKENSGYYTLILGGYKGLLLSKEFNKETLNKDFNSAVYIDIETKLPYGLVTLSISE